MDTPKNKISIKIDAYMVECFTSVSILCGIEENWFPIIHHSLHGLFQRILLYHCEYGGRGERNRSDMHTLLAPALMDSICSRHDEKLFFSILRREVPESGVISNPISFENCKDKNDIMCINDGHTHS